MPRHIRPVLGETAQRRRARRERLVALARLLRYDEDETVFGGMRTVWIGYALGSALFAGLTSILAKCGIRRTDSTVATAIRTGVVLVFAWLMVFLTGAQRGLAELDTRTLAFLIFSGLATGASWLCYYRALQLGPASVVVPIDKLSILVTVLFARLVLGERLAPRAALGLGALTAGTLLLLV